jgi:uncharacterized protein YdeI (YjbR/CyaY-like superfamily)
MELYLETREEWRKWLEENHSSVPGIWLIYYKKTSGKARIPYDDAVEEALCFGWIDGKIKRVNDDYYMQWFTPRRPHSRWSKLNMSRAKKLLSSGAMKPAGKKAYNEALKKPELVYDVRPDTSLPVPDDLMDALKENNEAFKNFMNSPPGSRRMYIFWLNDAKRAETRKVRIAKIVERSEKNMRAGMM